MNVLIESVLWKYETLKNGKYAIQVRITLFRDVKYIGSGFSSLVENWDERNGTPKASHPKFKDIIKKVG